MWTGGGLPWCGVAVNGSSHDLAEREPVELDLGLFEDGQARQQSGVCCVNCCGGEGHAVSHVGFFSGPTQEQQIP